MPAKNQIKSVPRSSVKKPAKIRAASKKSAGWSGGPLPSLKFNKLAAGLLVVVFVVAGSILVFRSRAATIMNPRTTWAACTNGGLYAPLSDSAAAALITRQPETRPKNATPYIIGGVSYQAANSYVPTTTEISAFQNSKNRWNETVVTSNPYSKYVTGNSTLTNPSTDDLIQWAAHKWGIPEDWLRAQYAQESWWNHFGLGDLYDLSQAKDYTSDPRNGVAPSSDTVSSWYSQEPAQAKYPDPAKPNPPYPQVYESLGITQVRFKPNLETGAGTEPLRWKSTAFNIDLQAAGVRFYYDDPGGKRTSWGDTTYVRCQDWNSIGGWFSPYPWGNSGQLDYVSKVQNNLSNRVWTTSNFINATFTYPSAITFSSATTDTTAPSAPANLSATAQSSSQINLSWTASTDNLGVTGYDVYRGGAKVATVATSSYSDTGLAASTTYTYYVIAKDAAGNSSAATNMVSAATEAAATTPTDTGAPTVTISSPINGSNIRRSVGIKATARDNIKVTKMEIWIDGNRKATSTSGSISYGWNSRKAARGAHTITVKAYDAAGNAGQTSVTVYK
ncbi:fibronectin type III domain-containing protein [Candidatus Parcubacteria bacterium]|nr:fibronectin type III domain-containing protein [Candidatus Parcubacteria bacterium]